MTDAIVDYVELPATDLAATKAFYTEVFGWDWTDYAPTYSATSSGSIEVALNAGATPAQAHAGGSENAIGPFVLLRTADIEGLDSRVQAAGGEIVSPKYEYPGGRRFHFADPSGNILGVYQPD